MRLLLVAAVAASLTGEAGAFMSPDLPSGALRRSDYPLVGRGVLTLRASSSSSAGQPLRTRRDALGAIAGGVVLVPLGASADAAADDARIRAGYDTLVDLLQNWDKYAGTGEEANGDNVRRQVGTVGNKSPLFGIRKVLLRKGVDIELFEEFDRKLTKIDSDSYSAIFADSSTAPKRGYQYMKDAKKATKDALNVYKEIMESLGL